MRAIKFRVFDKTTEEMYFPGEDDTQLVIGISHALDKDKNYMALWCDEGEIGREDMEFSQFTGLHDKNGVEIYEGDVLTAEFYPFQDDGESNYHGVIEWIDELSSFYMTKRLANSDKRGISDGISEQIERIDEFEVIGNIYKNPELLEVSD